MKKTLTLIISFLLGIASYSQCDKDLNMYNHFSIELENDTINYHTYSSGEKDSINSILLYSQGSSAMSLYQVKREGKSLWIGSSVPFDLKTIPKNYLFVVISKKELPFCTKMDEEIIIPKDYYLNETLEYRVNQVDKVIKDIIKRNEKDFEKIVTLGHSEGSDVVAKLGTINSHITHIGFWSGSGNSQFFDFPLFVRQDVHKGKITEEEALVKMDSLFNQYRDIMKNKDNIDKFWAENSYKRWYYFSEPPIDNLIKIDIPIYVAMGAKDKAVPIESVYLIPTEFIRKEKENLTFKIYPNLDHGFEKELENGEFEDHWDDVFREFLKWIDEN